MQPVRLPAAATNTLPRWLLFALCLLYILPGLFGRDPWKTDDAAGFGVMWTMAHGGLHDWLWPNIAGMPMPEKGPLAAWLGAAAITLFGGLLDDATAARMTAILAFVVGSVAVWYTAYMLGRRPEAQPLRLAFGGQPKPSDYGRTLADGALLIYLGSLGLLMPSHSTSAEALQVSLVACVLYAATHLFEVRSLRAAALLGAVLGLLALAHQWIVPLALWFGLIVLASFNGRALIIRLLLVSLPVALIAPLAWFIACDLVQPYQGEPFKAWMQWNLLQIGFPSFSSLQYLIKNLIWFAWPAWPFAAWAVYAWRRQHHAPHITLPLTFVVTATVLALLGIRPEEADLLPLLPPLAILAAFGLPTMKRGAINAVDWFSVMTLSTCAAFIWIGWIAKQTGWPEQLARNALKLAPGFEPEFNLLAFLVAALATVSWIAVVHWRISRRPAVLWRAVVLSSGGGILCWLLLTTLWLPWINYGKSYASVARELADNLPAGEYCVETNVGPGRRASFVYFGDIPFRGFADGDCRFLLLQDHRRGHDDTTTVMYGGARWQLLWEGRRPSDRDERFRFYQRMH